MIQLLQQSHAHRALARKLRIHLHMLHLLSGHCVDDGNSSRSGVVAGAEGVDKLAGGLEVDEAGVAVGELGRVEDFGVLGRHLDQAVDGDVGDEHSPGGRAEGSPAGGLLSLDLTLALDGREGLVLLVQAEDDGAKGRVGHKQVLAAGDGGGAKEHGGALGGSLGEVGVDLGGGDGERSDEAFLLGRRVALDGGEEGLLVAGEEDLRDGVGGALGGCGLAEVEDAEGVHLAEALVGEGCARDAGLGARSTDAGHLVLVGSGDGDGKLAGDGGGLADHGEPGRVCGVDGEHGKSVGARVDGEEVLLKEGQYQS